ncbi:GNAT family N-acetyltransferase [Streptomyces triticirhizae]|uniref:GNAT family N-acetyltransferase n=1 Tax=Streptomyces triticirhizae TaxID=2483353 RepID=A0A3M2M0N5_9ACTN|nr:GNAT family N-acetyltransferase [Streptomyces triticirhizae]RMI43259.1 GNAT family N-acetyltransferase [Streptomyces triticirhizae]RMI44786.1 GNAT family N-acetyltransferase [Streptomyces triticirhizae]
MTPRVERRADRWLATVAGRPAGELSWLDRPDGRRFLVARDCAGEAVGPLLDAALAGLPPGELAIECDEAADQGPFLERGFTVRRREHELRLPARVALRPLPAGLAVITAATADPVRLAALDEALRRDVPGVGKWRNDPLRFAERLRADPQFDPATWLVAVDEATGDYRALARIWIRAGGEPRLGLIGVLPAARRRGLAGALLTRALTVVAERGAARVVAGVDDTNAGSLRLLRSLGAQRVGGAVELVRPAVA